MSDFKRFVAKLKTNSISTTNRFSVVFSSPKVISTQTDLQSLLLYCNASTLPGININTTPNISYGDNYEVPYEKIYSPVTLEFYMDSDFVVKDYFDNWIQNVIDPVTRQVQYYEDYTTDINIIVHDKNNKNVYLCTLYDAYPKTMSDMQLSYENKDIARLQVLFAYRYYRTFRLSDIISNGQGAITDAGGIIASTLFRNGINTNNLDSIEFVSGKIPDTYLSSFTQFQNSIQNTDFRKIL